MPGVIEHYRKTLAVIVVPDVHACVHISLVAVPSSWLPVMALLKGFKQQDSFTRLLFDPDVIRVDT